MSKFLCTTIRRICYTVTRILQMIDIGDYRISQIILNFFYTLLYKYFLNLKNKFT